MNTSSNISQFPRRKLQPFDVICPAIWQDVEPEPVQWLVKGCIPRGTVCLFSGDSGLGKSLLMQQLQTAAALGRDWLGFEVARCRSFGFYCEDPKNILHWRQREICRHFSANEGDLEDMMIAPRVGLDNVLMDFNRRTDEGRVTPVFDQLKTYIGDFGAELSIIDTAAHTFNGNENIRAHVTAFISALQEIASMTGGAVILCSHPSVSSMQSGTGYSGSTAWRATVRAHMYLKRPKGYDDEADESDPNERILKTMKSNWGAGSGTTRLRWENGVFVSEPSLREPASGIVGKLSVEQAVLRAVEYVIGNGDRIAAGRQSNNNIGRVISRLPSCKTIAIRDIFDAADSLLEKGALLRVGAGRPGKRVMLLRTPSTRYPDESSDDE